MGEKKRYRLPMDFPFYTQLMNAENWEAEEFASLEEAESWSARSCGIASLRMVLDGFGRHAERHGPMIRKGVVAGAYKDGVGWIHRGLAELAADYGIYGEALRGRTVEDLKAELDRGHPCIISIAPRFWGGKPNPIEGGIYGKGGHLVPVFGYETEDDRLTAFLCHHPSSYDGWNRPRWWVPMEDFLNSFGGNLIRFSQEPLESDGDSDH